MSDEKIFVGGIYPRARTEKTPDFIVGSFGLNVKQLGEWIGENKGLVDDKGFINIVMKVSQGGKPYAEVDTWKPDKSDAPF